MNAQSNHSTNDTTDPQFLGPEAGQQAGGFEEPTYDLTATYSPDDNKLRLSSATRLDRDVYVRISAIVDARFSLIVDGETASPRARRGGAQVPGRNVAQPSTISLKHPPTRVVRVPVLGLD